MWRWVVGIKSILWILVILRGVYGVMGPPEVLYCSPRKIQNLRTGCRDGYRNNW